MIDAPNAIVVRTSATDPLPNLAQALPAGDDLTCWLRHGDGLIGLGTAHHGLFNNATAAETWWLNLARQANHHTDPDLADEPMAQPLAFISFPFAEQGPYEVVVPRLVIGQRRGLAWQTTWLDQSTPTSLAQPTTDAVTADNPSSQRHPTPALRFQTGSLDHDQWIEAVRQAIGRIRNGDLDKVVLARDEVTTLNHRLDPRLILTYLAERYSQTWTFCVRHLVGASPELLVRQDRGLVTSRVLAGTIQAEPDDTGLARALSSSSKDLAEHEYAVASVAEALRGRVGSLHVPEAPFVLRLPNVMHLASDITAVAKLASTVLGLANAIHPSAAVCGTPTAQARQVIAQLEHLDRGRYAGPVGWVNAAGDGEIALALRCGMIEPHQARIFAGCGIVAESDPESEWAETIAKLAPMKQALASALGTA